MIRHIRGLENREEVEDCGSEEDRRHKQPLVKAKDEECPQQKTKKHLRKKKNGWEFGI